QCKMRIKLEVRKKGLVIAAAEASFKEPDGRVKLTDFSVAMFKDSPDAKFQGGVPEINTIQSDYAFLTFDEPITSPMDMNRAHIIGGELRGKDITIINNRRTEAKNDDLEVGVTGGPLFYDERAARIWTDGYVTLLDKQSRPDPTMVKGNGMEMLLAKESAGPKSAKPNPTAKNDLSGVDEIKL